ncbi:MAG TPA: hypothetical protein VHA15_03490 [Burkholderiales bacterium]|nr:hypothetical protein [Burkholderiales bacterium]
MDWRYAWGLAWLALGLAAMPAAGDDGKAQAISRLAASHDPEIPVAIGRVVVKQAGLKAIRQRLAEAGRAAGLGPQWNGQAPEWQAAERAHAAAVDGIIGRELEQGRWMQDGWAQVAASVLNAEEADEIAHHFATPAGREQRVVVELLIVGETVMANYTFTNRIDATVPGLGEEVARLQKIWWDREPFRVRNFDGQPGAIRFAGENPGVKYTKALAIQGIEVITRRIDAAAAEAARLAAATPLEEYLDAWRRRTGG